MFSAATGFFFNPKSNWNKEEILTCGDCLETAKNLGKEAASHFEGKIRGGYTAQVMIQEIQSCVLPRSHTRHNIDNSKTELILKNIVCRLSI